MNPPSPFENLCAPSKALKAELPDANEQADLVHTGRARLADAQNPSLAQER